MSTPRFLKHDWMPGIYIASGLVVVAWGAFLRTGSISTLWPMLGIANQLLATTALCVGTTVIINTGRARYAWVTLVPLAFVATTTLTRGLSVDGEQLPQAGQLPGLARRLRGHRPHGLHGRAPGRFGRVAGSWSLRRRLISTARAGYARPMRSLVRFIFS